MRERAGLRGGAVGRSDGEEFSVSVSDEPEDWRGVEGPEAADELAVRDDTAEGAGDGGTGEVGRGVEAQEYLLLDLVREDGMRRRGSGSTARRRRRCHPHLAPARHCH